MGKLLLLAVLLSSGEPPPPDSDLLRGIRQVREGDFEEAIATLDGAVRRLSGPPERGRDLVQAYLYLGIAYVALGKPEAARLDFREALARDQHLSLSTENFSPKVVSVFEEARNEFAPKKGGGGKTALILAGAGGAAAAGILLSKGGGQPSQPATFTNARFGIDVVVCPAGTINVLIPFSILVDATSGSSSTNITGVTTTLVIVNSPAVPSEVGTQSAQPSSVVPATLPTGQVTTIRVDSSLLCGNGGGSPPRYNEWVGRLTLMTSSGVFTLETQDRLHVNIP